MLKRDFSELTKRLILKENFKLYVILDKGICGSKNIVKIACQVIKGGADVIQLRDKKATRREFIKAGSILRKLTKEANVTLIVNDRVDIARACNADGVHLGEEDIPIKVARSILGEDKIIGASVHSISQAIKAEKEGADYVGIGPIFPTEIKPYLPAVGVRFIKKIEKVIKIPFVAIGGINQVNITEVMRAGAEKVAVCRAIICAKDVYLATKRLKKILIS